MARKTMETRLAELEAQTKTIKARLSKRERTHDTRRKVLLGAFVLHRLEASKDEEFSRRLGDWLRRDFADFLTRDADKDLFADILKPPPVRSKPLEDVERRGALTDSSRTATNPGELKGSIDGRRSDAPTPGSGSSNRLSDLAGGQALSSDSA